MTDPIATIEGLIEDWKRHDLDAVLDRLDDEIVYHYHVGSPPLEGKGAIRRFLEKFGAGQEQIRWRIVHHARSGDVLMVEGVDDYVDARGRRIRTPYMGCFEFRNGRIWRWRDYLDPVWIRRAKDGSPLEDWMAELVEEGRGGARDGI